MDPTQAILLVVVAVVMGWFAFGVVWNIRRGNAVLKWMQAGLPRLGEKTTLRWMGSSAVELVIAKARQPFRRVELIVVLEPRDVPWFWLMSRAQGRRDMLIVRGQLATAPQFEFDLLSPGSWSERETVGRGAGKRWETESLSEARFCAPSATRPLSRQIAPAALEAARSVNPIVWRLSSRRESPQFELHVPLPDPRRDNASDYFNALRDLGEQMSRR